MSVIPCHYLSSSAPSPKITVLHNIHHSSRHDYVALSVQISESLLRHIPPLSHQNLSSSSVSSAQFPQVNRRNWADWSPGFSIHNVISQLIIVQGLFPSDGVSSGTRYALPGRSGSYICKSLLAPPCHLSQC